MKSLKHADKSQKASAHVNVGTILQEKNNLLEAKENYQKAIKIDPENKNAILNLGVIQLENKNLEKAEKFFRLVLDKDPSNITASSNLAGTLLIQDRADEGWSYYENRLSQPGKIIDIPKRLKNGTEQKRSTNLY